ncbi:MAG: hypothetical protein KCHDKBKB_01122 [Elusimicrobia bacterium]|nr:hypothetical protein [Elusimicrobiota bacterium]
MVVGCGQLGSRHLQAVATLPLVGRIDVVDPHESSHAVGKQRLFELSDRQENITTGWHLSIDDAPSRADLCIVATQANRRCAIIRELHEKLGVKNFLVEKIVSQSVEEYLSLLDFVEKNRLNIWVNFKARAHPSHLRIKSSIKNGEPLVFHVTGGNHGLANNGVHAADLFVYFSGAQKIERQAEMIENKLISSKRGAQIFDLSGTLVGQSSPGSTLSISFSADHEAPGLFSIGTPTYRAIVDDAKQFMIESKPEDGWIWRAVPFQANMTVSHMSRGFVTDILLKGQCVLPTLREAFPAHEYILSSLKPHFSRLLKSELELCPVT